MEKTSGGSGGRGSYRLENEQRIVPSRCWEIGKEFLMGRYGFTLLFSLAVCVFTLVASAQKSDKEVARTTATGCLQKGNESDVFAITGENGKNYELVSGTIKLSAHVGHKVRVTGTLIEEESEEQEREAGEGWAGKIYVTSLKMVSETCKMIRNR